MIAHTGRTLLLRLVSVKDVFDYLNTDAPIELQQKVVKKAWNQYHSLQEQEQTSQTLDQLNTLLIERLQLVFESIKSDNESLTTLQQLLDQCSVLFNKFVTFPTDSQSSFTQIIPHLLICLEFFTGSRVSTEWAEELATNPSLKQSTCDSILRFAIGLLSAYPKNESFHELYEGDLWNIIILLAPISITTNIESCFYPTV